MQKRLNELAAMVDPDSRLADVGTDHAYLPIKLVKDKKISFAIASDIAAGPLRNAKKDITEAGLENKICTRLGAGLTPIKLEDHVDTVVIAGMGGKLITSILDDKRLVKDFKTLILEPNVGEPGVRVWLTNHNYQVVSEKLVLEAGHTYELIKAKKAFTKQNLSPEELYFGPKIIKEKGPVFKLKWQGQLDYHQKLLRSLNQAKKKNYAHLEQISQEISFIKEALVDES